MMILKVTNLILIGLSTVLVPAWTYFEGAVNHFLNEQKPVYPILLVWGGTALLVFLRGFTPPWSSTGSAAFAYRFSVKPYTLCMMIYCCGFTLHALQATTPEFDVDHLNMPFYLPWIFLPLHFILACWMLFSKGDSQADRGLYLILLFHAMNGAVFNIEFFLILGISGITLIEALIENRGRWSLPPLFLGLPLLLLIVLAALSTAKGINPVKSTQALNHMAVCAVVFLLITSKPRESGFYWKLIGFTLLGALLVLLAVVILLVLVWSYLGPVPVLTTRLTIFYQHPNFLAPYLAMITLLALMLLYNYRRRPPGLCMVLLIPLVLAALWLTDSRAGFLGFAAGLAVLFLLLAPIRTLGGKLLLPVKRFGPKILASAGAVLLAALLLMTVFYSEPLVSGLRQNTRIRRALDYRLDAWSNSVEVIKDHRLHGIGLDTFISAKKFPPGSKFAHEDTAPHPHNVLLYIAQSTGLPALAVFLFLLGAYLYTTIRIIRHVADGSLRTLAIGCISASTALLFCGMLDLGLSLTTLFPGPVWLFMGITASIYSDRLSSKRRGVRLDAIKALLPAAAVVLAMAYGAFLPTNARILLKRAYLSEQVKGTEHSMRLTRMALASDPLLNRAREFLFRRYIARKDYLKAYDLIEEASRLEPENAELQLNMGIALSMSGELERTAEAYQKAVEIDHGSVNLPRYYAMLINAEALAGWKTKAASHLKEAIKRDIAAINLVHWKIQPHPSGRDDQYLEIGETEEILRLEEILNEIHGELRASRNAGEPQDRFDWFAIFQAFDNALIFDRALAVLDDIEAIFQDKEAAAVQALRAIVERKRENIEQSGDLLDLAGQLGDDTNAGAVFYYQSRKSEVLILQGKFDEAIDLLEETLSRKRDYLNYRQSFIVALDSLIKALNAKNNESDKIKPLQMRLFFCGQMKDRIPLLIDLASAYGAAGRFHEAEQAVLEALDLAAVIYKRVFLLEEPSAVEEIRRAALLLAGLYEDAGLATYERLERAWHETDFFSSNPARYLFKYYFLLRNGMPEQTLPDIRLALMDEKDSILLNELKVECAQVLDEPDTLWLASHDVSKAYQARGIDLEARTQSLFAAVLEDRENLSLILDLIHLLTWQFNFDHALNVVREAENLHPENPELHWLAARIHRLQGDSEAALQSLEKAVQLDPSHFRATGALANLRANLGRKPPGRGGS